MILSAAHDAYTARWGAPTRSASFQVDEYSMDVLKWSVEATHEGVGLYATLGASAHPMAGQNPKHRAEFFVGLFPEKDEIASALAALALYAPREGVTVAPGHTVPVEGGVWPGSDMRHFLVIKPVSDFIQPLTLADGTHIEFLQALPIFDSELAYKTRHGAEALLAHWEQLQVPFWDSNRDPQPATS